MTMNTIFVKAKDMSKSTCSLEEREIVSDGGGPLPHHPSCGILKKGNNDKKLNTNPSPSLEIRNNLFILRKKKKNKTNWSSSNKISLFYHCCKKRGDNIVSYWYVEACYLCGKKFHQVASCWENQATCHMIDFF
jgi:hypothetical protein